MCDTTLDPDRGVAVKQYESNSDLGVDASISPNNALTLSNALKRKTRVNESIDLQTWFGLVYLTHYQGLSIIQASHMLNVNHSTAQTIMRLFRKEGRIHTRPRGGKLKHRHDHLKGNRVGAFWAEFEGYKELQRRDMVEKHTASYSEKGSK